MEKAIFPLYYMNITQGVGGNFSHMGSMAIDLGSKGDKEVLYAPFTGIVKKVYKTSGNFVWLESKEKVLWADGTIDYMTVLTGHDDNVESLYVGKEIKQGTPYYMQGTSGNTEQVHVHIEVGKGTFTGNGWYKNEDNVWMINNAVHPAEAFFLPEDIVIDNDSGYPWKKEGTEVIRTEGDSAASLQKIFTCKKDGTYYLKLYNGENLYIENVNEKEKK